MLCNFGFSAFFCKEFTYSGKLRALPLSLDCYFCIYAANQVPEGMYVGGLVSLFESI